MNFTNLRLPSLDVMHTIIIQKMILVNSTGNEHSIFVQEKLLS